MSNSNPQHNWITIAYTSDRLEAETIAALLRSEDIPVFIRQESGGHALPLTVGIFGMIDVMVPSQHEELAISLLDKKHHFESPFDND